MAEEIERLNYYQLQFLGAGDFQAEQLYHRDMRRRHNLGPHTWGIVTGLELDTPATGSTGVYIRPGYAIDGFGREIVVGAPFKLDPAEFQFIKISNNTPVSTAVYIAFAEEQAGPPAFGYGSCDGEGQNDRVRELFRVVIDPRQPTMGPIRIDGKDLALTADPPVLPEDGSVPHQELPDAASARWLIRLGTVTWDGTAVTGPVSKERDYAGAVAAAVLSPTSTLRLRPRMLAPSPSTAPMTPEPEFATVEGQLRVTGSLIEDKDVRVNGRVYLHGADPNVPLWLSRAPAKPELHIEIGSDSSADHRLTVGPDGQALFTVSADDKVGIATGRLDFGDAGRQVIDVAGGSYGLGVAGSALFARTSKEFTWFRGGKKEGEGKKVMELGELDPSSNLLRVDGRIEGTSLRVTGEAEMSGDLKVNSRLRFLINGGNDNHELALVRHKDTSFNELRLILGEHTGGANAFAIGPIQQPSGQYKTNFRVTDGGDVAAEGNLSLKGNLTINGTVALGGAVTLSQTLTVQGQLTTNGTLQATGPLNANGGLSVAGNASVQAISVGGKATFAGDLQLSAGKAITYGTAGRYPIDIVSGVWTKTYAGDPSSTSPKTHVDEITVTTSLPHVSSFHLHVALAAIRNAAVANNSHWSVRYDSATSNGNQYKFKIEVVVGDADGFVDAISYVAFFIP